MVGEDGADLPLQLAGETAAVAAPRIFVLTEASQSLTFVNVAAEPVPSILRGFSAPVVLEFDYSDAQLLHLLAHDSDPFNRWEAGQRLAIRLAIQAISASAYPVSGLYNAIAPTPPTMIGMQFVEAKGLITAVRPDTFDLQVYKI